MRRPFRFTAKSVRHLLGKALYRMLFLCSTDCPITQHLSQVLLDDVQTKSIPLQHRQ